MYFSLKYYFCSQHLSDCELLLLLFGCQGQNCILYIIYGFTKVYSLVLMKYILKRRIEVFAYPRHLPNPSCVYLTCLFGFSWNKLKCNILAKT